MSFDPSVTMGNIITIVGTAASLLYAAHKNSIETAKKHEDTTNQFNALKATNENQFDNLNQKVDRVENKVDEGRRDIKGAQDKLNEVSTNMQVHSAKDEAVQKEITRRLDRIDNK